MSPRFADGQIVWARKAESAENGEIVLCVLNDQGYCKKLHRDEHSVKQFQRLLAGCTCDELEMLLSINREILIHTRRMDEVGEVETVQEKGPLFSCMKSGPCCYLHTFVQG